MHTYIGKGTEAVTLAIEVEGNKGIGEEILFWGNFISIACITVSKY